MDILRAAHEIDGYTLETGLSDASIERVVDSEMAGDLTMHIPKKKKIHEAQWCWWLWASSGCPTWVPHLSSTEPIAPVLGS